MSEEKYMINHINNKILPNDQLDQKIVAYDENVEYWEKQEELNPEMGHTRSLAAKRQVRNLTNKRNARFDSSDY